MLSESQIVKNWEQFREVVNTEFSGERKERLNNMYDALEDRIIICPASGKEHFHNAFPGGYIDHVLRVMRLAKSYLSVWTDNDEDTGVVNFTMEELMFCAMHHDLGKVGDLTKDYYIVNDSSWHREKQGLLYKFNPEIHNMTISDRTFNMLNQFGLKWNDIEFLGIKCTDGLYDSENEVYLKQADAGKDIKTCIVFVLHSADMQAAKVEQAKWRKLKNESSDSDIEIKSEIPTKNAKTKKSNSNMLTKESQKLFDGLFKE